jgi:CDGSH-type Zn-finger protein
MTNPIIAAIAPKKVSLNQGEEYYFCSCGRSNNQPFCDGSHSGSAFRPVKYAAPETKKVFFCGCKSTASQPLCDGSHKQI